MHPRQTGTSYNGGVVRDKDHRERACAWCGTASSSMSKGSGGTSCFSPERQAVIEEVLMSGDEDEQS